MKKKDLIYLFILVGLVLLLINSCKKDEKEPTLPILTTSAVSSISQNTAISGGIITNDGGAKIKTRGVCWGLNSNPTISDSITIDGVGSGSFTSNIIGLTSGTIYFVRAYATNSVGTGYGNEFSFSTTINDIDGNVYHIVTIGTQVWMVENLKTTKYRNGNLIPNVTDNTQWCNLTSGAYCNLNNDINI